ncbi:UPF0545 protein C22orf39 homolog [Teleopsis dalmanni]|uniref:UPF0545 protein C22orf39 homolog n=1 Tax=Teleopsis dalmanni TaxID=139649 RepID=UPI0018CFB383|nr:UPF0545 protein C22orf39 homolog [Teleopsis dalmanni]
MSNKDEISENSSSSNIAPTLKNAWSIRSCSLYKDEYDNCTSIKARFHQYFVDGENTDCTQWKTDYDNCIAYEESERRDVTAGEAIIKSEQQRRETRMKAHYGNTTWKKRSSPPDDWSKPLPEWLTKRYENSYLKLKQMELEGQLPVEKESKSYCTIM